MNVALIGRGLSRSTLTKNVNVLLITGPCCSPCLPVHVTILVEQNPRPYNIICRTIETCHSVLY